MHFLDCEKVQECQETHQSLRGVNLVISLNMNHYRHPLAKQRITSMQAYCVLNTNDWDAYSFYFIGFI